MRPVPGRRYIWQLYCTPRSRYDCDMPVSEENLRALSSLAQVARQFIALIDSFESGKPRNLYRELELLLPRLHETILPVTSEMADEKHAEFDTLCMTSEQAAATSRLIDETVSPEKNALMEWHKGIAGGDPEDNDPDVTRAFMFFDDLAGIYRDLHDGLALWNVGTPDAQAEVSWQWRWNYEYHWGEHLFRAMLTVHEIRYQFCED